MSQHQSPFEEDAQSEFGPDLEVDGWEEFDDGVEDSNKFDGPWVGEILGGGAEELSDFMESEEGDSYFEVAAPEDGSAVFEGFIDDEEAEVIGADTRKRIRRTTRAPFRYICHVEIHRGGHAEPGRTGTLIGPKTVLTAAHCIWDETNERLEDLSTTPIRIIPGRNGSSEPLPATQAAKLIVPPGYNSSKGSTSMDFGIIQLKDAIGNRIGYWSSAYKRWKKDKTGTSTIKGSLPNKVGVLKVNLSGYPNDKGGIKQYWSYNQTRLLKDGMLHYLNDTAGGHSGSPVWVRRNASKGGRVLVGIHVARDDDIGEKANQAVFINNNVRQFIRANTI